MSSRENPASDHARRNVQRAYDSDATPPHPYLAFCVRGFGDDAEYEYTHPSTPAGRHLQELGFQLPTPGDFRRPPVNPPVRQQLPSIRDLLHGLTGAAPLSTNVANSIASNRSPTPLLPAPSRSNQERSLPRQASNNNDENENPMDQLTGVKLTKKRYSGKDLIILARAVVEKAPFLEPYGKKTAAWEAIKVSVMADGFSHSISVDVLRQKAEALDPESRDDKVKTIAATLKNQTDAITIAALLERMEDQWDRAKNADEKKKTDLKKKHDEDRIGGEAIRSASMYGQRKRRASDDRNASEVNAEVDAEAPASQGTSTGDLADDEDDDRHAHSSKRRRLLDRRPTNEEMMALYKEDIKARQEQEKANQKVMEKFIQRADRNNRTFQDTLQQLLALEVRRNEREEEEHQRKMQAENNQISGSPAGSEIEPGYISQEL